MGSLETLQAKIIAGGLALLVTLAAGAAAGAVVNGWRLEAGHARELATKDQEISGLKAAIEKQNGAVEGLRAATEAAHGARKLAESYAQRAIGTLDQRAAAVAGTKATDCPGVLREAWGAGK
ncbi:hypothetical protein [Massilia sp. TS11]|uniref:hypothetical protein n=1 Tax=Massilia sp. TS11 TaxID=2908003 RepID=UPI001EDB15D9|nr:hypothetical protein [Massilia sp. TS11]MCG2585525.1 hypothetical protein [Massilia sp. TS11]